ncbi:SH3 domain-containing protein, partial [bacterium]|nr:SH3 domain-containing protein [bacterium]
NGDKVTIIGESGDWYKIKYQGRTTFVHQNYVSTAKKPASRAAVSTPSGNASGGSSGGGVTPPPAGGSSQSRIVAAAQALVGMTNFPYAPATNGGRLGCAQVVSTALKNAGALSRISLSVLGLMADLKAIGWKLVSAPPFSAGDVITWSTYDRTGDGRKDPDTHVGIIMASGNSVQAMSNSSSRRMPRLNSPFYQPISHVLRKV